MVVLIPVFCKMLPRNKQRSSGTGRMVTLGNVSLCSTRMQTLVQILAHASLRKNNLDRPSSFFLMVCAPSSLLGFGEVGAGGSPGGHQETWDECSDWGSPVRGSHHHLDQSLVNRLFAHHPRNGASCKTSRSRVGTMGSVQLTFCDRHRAP